MKAVLISIRPEWVVEIANGRKTIEVRKTHPKIDTPFKCYIYCCKAKDDYHITEWHDWDKGKIIRHDGKVFFEFICDKIYDFKPTKLWCYHGKNIHYLNSMLEYSHTCLHYDEIEDYGKGKTLYGWHISNLKVYDKPKEITEFHYPCAYPNNTCEDCAIQKLKPHCHYGEGLTRAPQSWGYVEELNND